MPLDFKAATFRTADDIELTYRHFQADTPRRILILHGLQEHGEEYVNTMKRLYPNGGVSWAVLDRRGHGSSGGRREDVSLETLERDLYGLLNELGWGQGSFVGLGHSFGGLLLLGLLAKHPSWCQGAILSSPFIGMPDGKSSLEVNFFMGLGIFFPTIPVKNPVPIDFLTRNEDRREAYQNDPLIKNEITLGTLCAIRKIQQTVMKLREVKVPLMVLQAGDERVVSQKKMLQWYEASQAPIREWHSFPRLRHEVFNEIDNESVYKATRDFLEKLWV